MNLPTANTADPDVSAQPRSPHSSAPKLLIIIGLVAACLLILYHSLHTPTYTIDSYFYLSKAKQFAAGEGLRTSWNDGIDPKYFPGYSLALALSFSLGGGHVPVQLLVYVLSVILFIAICKEIGMDTIEQALSSTAFLANPIVIKWHSLPMAEGTALAFSLAAVLAMLRSLKTRNYVFYFSAWILAGFALITRAEAAFLLVVFCMLLFRRRHEIPSSAAMGGGLLFFLPLILYWAKFNFMMGSAPAYVNEFRYTLAGANIVKNFVYNIYAPFGLMHKFSLGEVNTVLAPAVATAGVIWLLVGGILFLGGLVAAVAGRTGSVARASAILFLLFAAIHSLWYYRYERFMMLALPFAALVWASSVTVYARRWKQDRWLPLAAQTLMLSTGLVLAHHFSSVHSISLQKDAARLNFVEIAQAVGALNKPEEKPVLTDLGPHLAYYLDAQTYLDDDHGNYWQRAFAPERTIESLKKLGIKLIVTRLDFDRWTAEHHVPPEMKLHFQEIRGEVEGATIIRYLPADVTGS
ncbi:MAG: hypothetical protein C4520_03715 [Candidatus Abyssobacteria bacterium SURF_5]|uniref:Glycosyltransferase RgtA/B/C/D-like domain-containing protein n=1 Tax=Abyssobacteria bacterium (strain SURF_5) TaxID=2093360 RepID=A0A3A4P0L1_ABYX5|nr:MAG: hypothetical protein C4520_03715 [Candidatus Abyssubacteria bacterium SURF_5]